jgi:outer membrane protein OmpA-like peptidoglycan-associated protein/tetratricopeptide (TPR) repeat protein
MRQVVYICLILFFILPEALSQDRAMFKKTFIEAEFFFMTEKYREAAHLYEELLKTEPENANLHFLVAACYLSIYGEKNKAIPHLERAVLDMSPGYREGSYKESSAPREALFALARAYHIQEKFDIAIEQYLKYRGIMIKRHFADIEYVNNQIKSCELGKIMIKRPLDVQFLTLGEEVNKFPDNFNPVLSYDDSTLIYMTNHPFYRTIMLTRRIPGIGWTDPLVINEEIGSEGNCYPTSLSANGKELYIVKKDGDSSDVYISYRKGDKFTKMIPLNNHINSDYSETHACISYNGKFLYFTSDRPGGQGALDIWVSETTQEGDWGEPRNLGPQINSHYNEETPFLAGDGNRLYFSSQGHATMGGFDFFVAEKIPSTLVSAHRDMDKDSKNDDATFDAGWSSPVNLCYPISTADDDLFYNPRRSGQGAYLSAIVEEISPIRSIYSVVLGGEEYFVLNSILFGFNSDTMDESAIAEAERIMEVMDKNPGIGIQLTGHTDAIGADDYNLHLSERRAQSIADYLIGKGIDSSRLKVTAAGEIRPIALNKYEDGTDSPDGRRLNRHVSIKLENLQSENIRIEDVFVPYNLRPKTDQAFSILLVRSENMLDTIPGMVLGEQTELIITDSAFLYMAGNFHHKTDAMMYLNEVIDTGYPDAGMLEQKDLMRLIDSLSSKGTEVMASFTIQIMALKKPVDVSYFSLLPGTIMYVGKDGFHRYVYGDFKTLDEANKRLTEIRAMGYKDAFINSILPYQKLSE